MKKLLMALVLSLALAGCGSVTVAIGPTPTPAPMPTSTPTPRLTTDAECDAVWIKVVDPRGADWATPRDWETARMALSRLLANPSGALPGSSGEYLVWCVDEGWRGYFGTTSVGQSSNG